MPINVTDFDSMIKEFMIARFKSNHPNIDTSEGSAFDDLYVEPMISTIQPLMALINATEIKTNLNNAEYMTKDELDEYVVGNYLIPRKVGQKAIATETLNFISISNTDNLVIPAGSSFSTSDGLKFVNVNRKEFTPAELYTMYNTNTMYYEVTIPLEAYAIGSKYNVSENQITSIDSVFNTNLISVTNKAAAIGGKDEEGNSDYAQRAKEYYISRHLGTPYGYRQFIMENFNEIQDIYVSGYKDEFMTRDRVLVYDSVTGLPVPMSIGGKTDIYVKGSNYAVISKDIVINSNNIFLQTDYDLIDQQSISIVNRTDETKTVTFSSTKDITTEKCVIKLLNPDISHISYDPSIESTIDIYYRYDNSGTNVDKIETFIVGKTSAELLHPFKDIIDIKDVVTSTSYSDTKYYDVNKTGIIGTSKESVEIYFVANELDIVPNGHTLNVSYSINSTINSLDEFFNFDENRIVTTDILFKEADTVYVNMSFKVRLSEEQSLDDFKINTIKNAVADFFNQAPLGYQIQESDIVSWIYNDESVSSFLDFIALPFDSFYVTSDISAPIEVRRDGTYLNASKITYPILNKIEIKSV